MAAVAVRTGSIRIGGALAQSRAAAQRRDASMRKRTTAPE
jgi:hypothetical protein